ncbi:SDR family oxidoreductase [Capsulimonas corticalis]|nr:SDR family oxidoreductase [Capsulimonas corticalis]
MLDRFGSSSVALRSHCERLQSILLTHASVEECAVLPRRTPAGDLEAAAYVVMAGPFLPDRLEAHLRAGDAPDPPPAVYVPLAAIPRTPMGTVDEEALCAIPVFDAALIDACEAALRAAPGVQQAAAVIGEHAPRRPALHLGDLVPEPPAKKATAPPAAPASDRTPEASIVAARPSFSEGPAILLAEDQPVTLPDALRRASEKFGDCGIVYVQSGGAEIEQTYAELRGEAERILGGLRALGLSPGDKVLFQLERNQDFIPVFWGCVLGGFVPVPISIAPTYDEPNANVAKLHNAWLMLDKPVIVAGDELAPRVRSLTDLLGIDAEEFRVVPIGELRAGPWDTQWRVSHPDDVAIMLLTSGSTGKPKGVIQRHSSLLMRSAASAQNNDFDSRDVSLNWFPMDHVGGIVMFHVHDLCLGCRQVHVPTNDIIRAPLQWLDLTQKHRATITWAPNFAYGLINARAEEVAKGDWDLTSLRFILNAGEAIVARTARRFLEILRPHGLPATAMRPAWGMSETSSAVTFSEIFRLETTSDDDSFVEVGAPIPGFAMQIVDSQNEVAPEGTIGRLLVRGPSVTTAYYQNDEANREAFTGDGWFNTGDLGVMRDGRLTITGRQKDVIIINGVNFYGHEIEAVVEDVDGVEVSFTAACAVRTMGKDTDEICVFFHAPLFARDREASAELNEERAHLLREIRGAVVRSVGVNPSFLVPVEKSAVPKTEIGKIQRAQMRKRFEDGEFDEIRKDVDVLMGGGDTIPDWFFRTAWRPKALGAETAGESVGLVPGVSVVFIGADPLGSQIAERLAGFGPVVTVRPGDAFVKEDARSYQLRPEAAFDYRELIAAAGALGMVRRVVHCWTYGNAGDGGGGLSAVETGLAIGAESILALTQALTQMQGADVNVRIEVVSSGSQDVLMDDPIAIDRISVLGLIKTIAQETPYLDISHLDLEISSHVGADRRRASQVLAELMSPVRSHLDREAAYRDDRRFVSYLERAPVAAESAGDPVFTPGGLVVLTGGLGGVGAEVAARLLSSFQSRLLLTGRRALPDAAQGDAAFEDESAGAERLRTYRRLESLARETGGEVRYAAVDIADAESLSGAVARFRAEWGQPLEAVLHLAGAYHDRLLGDETRASFHEVLRPKVQGTWALHHVVTANPGCAFVGFSSAAACFGGAMVGAYATANRFLESFSRYQRRGGVKSYSIAWSTWDEVGMSRGYGGKDPLRARGFMDMPASQGVDSLLAALYRQPSSMVIGLDGDNAFLRRHIAPEGIDDCRTVQATAYCTLREGASPSDLPAALDVADRYGLPVRCPVRRLLDAPLTETGEIDREALSDRMRRGAGGARRVAARTDTEQRMLPIWREALGASAIGVFDNFFELGGHSLLATQVISRLRDEFGVEVPLRLLFEAPTVAALSEWLDRSIAAPDPGAASIARVPRDRDLPLSFTQQRLWFIDQMDPGNPVYNVPIAFRLMGDLDVAALSRAVNEIVRRHEALRTVFPVAEGIPSQSILPELSVEIPIVDLSGLSLGARESEAMRRMTASARRPFDLANGPLLRAALFDLGGDERMLLVNTHHIVFDGWSIAVFNRELSALYNAYAGGLSEAGLPPLPIQYADYTVWLRRSLQGDALERQMDYWRTRLAGAAPTLDLPADRARPAAQSYRGAKLFFSLPPALADAARDLSQQQGATLFMTLFAAFQTVLLLLSGQEDLCVGSPIAGRTYTELEPLIGFLANTLVLRGDLSGNPTFVDLIGRARETALGAYANQETPLDKLVEIVRPPRDPSRNPLVQTNFRLQTIAPEPLDLQGLDIARIEIDPGVARFDVAMELWSYPGSFGGYLEYNTDLFEKERMERMVSLFERTLTTLIGSPGQPIETLFPDLVRGVVDRKVSPAKRLTQIRSAR